MTAEFIFLTAIFRAVFPAFSVDKKGGEKERCS
jgi:hypothetical protein